MKLQFPQSISNIKTVEELARFVSNSLEKVQSTLNGNVDMLENGANDHINFTFPNFPAGATLTADVGVAHNLGRVPRGYTKTSSSNSILSLQNGANPNTATTLYLRAGSTGTVTVLVF